MFICFMYTYVCLSVYYTAEYLYELRLILNFSLSLYKIKWIFDFYKFFVNNFLTINERQLKFDVDHSRSWPWQYMSWSSWSELNPLFFNTHRGHEQPYMWLYNSLSFKNSREVLSRSATYSLFDLVQYKRFER